MVTQFFKGGSGMKNEFTAVIKHDGEWWLGWIEEVPGVNCQEASCDDLLESLRLALREALEFSRQDALASAGTDYREEKIAI
jgi:predicted RNase H-like HicB family nuclease